MALWFGQGGSSSLVGLEFVTGGLRVAHRCKHSDSALIKKMANITSPSEKELLIQFSDFAKKHALRDAGCNVVLAPKDYQIVLTEAPDVPDEELRDAVKWKLKDLIDIPVSLAAIDTFVLPSDSSNNTKKMVYVVAADIDKLRSVCDFVSNAGLTLKSIDISEFALRNVAVRLMDDESQGRGMAIAMLREGAGNIAIYKNGDLYLTRQFDLDYAGGLLDDLPTENLALQLQRSLDYYERQMGQAIPAAIYVCGENVSVDKITPVLKSSLAIPIEYLDISGAVKFAEDFDETLKYECLSAVGGSLRAENI